MVTSYHVPVSRVAAVHAWSGDHSAQVKAARRVIEDIENAGGTVGGRAFIFIRRLAVIDGNAVILVREGTNAAVFHGGSDDQKSRG
jgi:hypothetical protein